jgi:hypothetical protein
LVAVSWEIIRDLQRFVEGRKFSRCGGVAILADPVAEWFSIRASRFLEKAGVWNMATLVQLEKSDLRSGNVFPLRGAKKSINEVIDFFEDMEGGPGEAVLKFGVDLREWLFGPEPELGMYWPLAVTIACRQAVCLTCIQNVSGETSDIRICSLRKVRIEKEHEDFCLLHQRNGSTSVPQSIFGPMYRRIAGGPVGFRPIKGAADFR